MKIQHLAPFALLALSACGSAEPTDVFDGTSTADSETDALKARLHYEPYVGGVTYSFGCGIVRPDSPPCYSGFVLTYTKQYFDLQTTITHHTNQANKTISITVDTWSTSPVHSMIAVRPMDQQLGSLEANFGTTYKVTVYDRKHKVLWTGSLTPMLAM